MFMLESLHAYIRKPLVRRRLLFSMSVYCIDKSAAQLQGKKGNHKEIWLLKVIDLLLQEAVEFALVKRRNFRLLSVFVVVSKL